MTSGGWGWTVRIGTWLQLEFDVMRNATKRKYIYLASTTSSSLLLPFFLIKYLRPPESRSKCSLSEWRLHHNKSQWPQQQKNKLFSSLPASTPRRPPPCRVPDRPLVLPLGLETGLCVCGAEPDSAGCRHRNSEETHEPASLSPASWCLQPVREKTDEKQVEDPAMSLAREG